jgi:hypothetical protein
VGRGHDHAGWHKVVEAIGRKLQRPGLGELALLQASNDAQAWKRWAETYPDDPFVEDAWAKAEDLEISAARARVAHDRSAARRVAEVGKESAVAEPSTPVTTPTLNVVREPPSIPRELAAITAEPPRTHSTRPPMGIVVGSAAIVVMIAIVILSLAMRRPGIPVDRPPVGASSSSQSALVTMTSPHADSAPALRALDAFSARDWAITPADVLARRLLADTRLGSLEAAAASRDPRAQVPGAGTWGRNRWGIER